MKKSSLHERESTPIRSLTNGSTRLKSKLIPLTNQEKYNALKDKNPAIEKLKEIFDLDIPL